jgi:hypothetical protein
MSRKRPDWSLRLPGTITIPEVMTLRKLADVRELLGHLPERCRIKSTWDYVADHLTEASQHTRRSRAVKDGSSHGRRRISVNDAAKRAGADNEGYSEASRDD